MPRVILYVYLALDMLFMSVFVPSFLISCKWVCKKTQKGTCAAFWHMNRSDVSTAY